MARVAVANGLRVHLASRDTPSPALIYYITQQLGIGNNAGLINCTPSHNPVKDPATRTYLGTEYHGIRYNMPYGAVAPTRATDTIGRRAMEVIVGRAALTARLAPDDVTRFNPIRGVYQRCLPGDVRSRDPTFRRTCRCADTDADVLAGG